MEKKIQKHVGNILVFVIIANLPFLTVTSLIGIDTFIDSFHHPESYLILKNERSEIPGLYAGYIILEKPTNQDYHIKQGDVILYYSLDNELQQQIVSMQNYEQGINTYYTILEDRLDGPIYDQQIIGKIKGNLDENIWNALCVQIWDLSIDKLNLVALFSQK